MVRLSSGAFVRKFHRSAITRGALTSKPYAFTARPWELTTVDGIDNCGSLGANIQLQSRGNELVRVLPRTNDDINDDWIDDKTRFSYDGLKSQRLVKPLVRDPENPDKWDKNVFSWREAFGRIKTAFKSFSHEGDSHLDLRAITGSSVDLYSALAMTDFAELFHSNGTEFPVETTGSQGMRSQELPWKYRMNSTILGVEESDACLLVGTNLLADAPLLAARMRKAFLGDNIRVSQIGPHNSLSFPSEQLGLTLETLQQIALGEHPYSKVLTNAEKPMLILDSSLFERPDALKLTEIIDGLANNSNLIKEEDGRLVWNGVNVFHRNANDVGLLELGRTSQFKTRDNKRANILYLMQVQMADLPNGPEDVKLLRENNDFIIYQGSHGDELAAIADVVLPSAAFCEKTGIYTNVEGRSQISYKALPAPGLAKEDWKIIRALSEVLGNQLPYDSEEAIHQRLETFIPSVGQFQDFGSGNLNKLVSASFLVNEEDQLSKAENGSHILPSPLVHSKTDFFLEGHASARVSKVMATCSREAHQTHNNFLN